MVCISCVVIPVLLFVWHRFLLPIMLRFWNPWAKPVTESSGDKSQETIPPAEHCASTDQKEPLSVDTANEPSVTNRIKSD